MSLPDKNVKASKALRQRAQEFLSAPRRGENLMGILRHFESGADPIPCLLTLDMVFTTLLKNREMLYEVVPLRLEPQGEDEKFREWLKGVYEDCFKKVLEACENPSTKIQNQALTTAMNMVAYEGRYPLEPRDPSEHYVPLGKLKSILIKLLSWKNQNENLINKFEEYLQFNDVLFHTWRILPSLTAKSNPNSTYIINYLFLLHKLHVRRNEMRVLCSEIESSQVFNYEEHLVKRALNKVWNCVVLWEFTPVTHKKLLIVLLENLMEFLEKPLLLTDFLMDSLDVGGSVSLLALQGIFNLIQAHNLDYPNIYGKLYSMFEPEIFHTKYKARLFYLSNLFLSSTHLPENLVAAFVKRLARLALVAPSQDIIVICSFIGNLILRHPGLKCLLNHPSGGSVKSDPYIMEERDPLKSNAINSSLWEIKTLQNHVIPSVSSAAKFINSPLPSVEWDMGNLLEDTGDDIFDKEIKKHSKVIALAFERPNSVITNRADKLSLYINYE